MARLVVAEDDPKQAQLVRLYAENEGHAVTVVGDGRAALEHVRREPPDLLVLDVMLPRVDGLDVCRILRAETTLPIVMLTARSAEDDVLLGLDVGADDYVVKPYSPRQLMARIRSLLRRAGAHGEGGAADADRRLVLADLTVDPERHEVRYGTDPIECTPSEFTLLELMAARPGRVFTREQLMEHLHGTDRYVSRRTVDMHVMNLRRKLAAPVARPVVVATVYGIGYKLTDKAPDA